MQKLVLVHGLAGSPRWWAPVLPALRERYDVRALDLRRTPPAQGADAIAGELDGTEALVGHSLGGLICAQVATRRQVRMLVLVAPAGIPTGRSLPVELLALAGTVRTLRPRFVPTLAFDTLRWGPRDLVRGGWYAFATDLRADLDRITASTLIVWGEADGLVPRRLAESWRDAIPNARLAVIPRAAHVPMIENTSAFVDVLLDFLEDETGDDARS